MRPFGRTDAAQNCEFFEKTYCFMKKLTVLLENSQFYEKTHCSLAELTVLSEEVLFCGRTHCSEGRLTVLRYNSRNRTNTVRIMGEHTERREEVETLNSLVAVVRIHPNTLARTQGHSPEFELGFKVRY